MKRLVYPYRDLLIPCLLFLGAACATVCLHDLRLIALPFLFYAWQPLSHVVLHQPAKLFWFMLAMLPLSTEWEVTSSLSLDFPDEPLLIILAALVIARTIHTPTWFPRNLLLHPLGLLLALHVGWIGVCCLFSTEPLLSVKYLLAKTWYIIPFVVLPQVLFTGKRSFRWLAWCLLLPMLFVVLQTLFRHALYGFSFAELKYVFYPFFRNHVNYSSMLVCLLVVAWCAFACTPKDHAMRKWLLWGMIAGSVALFFAYSRGAWLALLAAMITAWLVKRKWLLYALVLALTITVGVVIWLVQDKHFMRFRPEHDVTVFHEDFGEHMSATLRGRDISNAERFYRWTAGARMLADKPLTGFGPNAFYLHYRPYAVRSFETWVSDNPEHSSVHNYFLLVGLEQGWPGLLLFVALFIAMLLYAQQLYHRLTDPFYKTIALGVACILAMIGVINSVSDMIETDKIGGLFWLGAGVLVWLSTSASSVARK